MGRGGLRPARHAWRLLLLAAMLAWLPVMQTGCGDVSGDSATVRMESAGTSGATDPSVRSAASVTADASGETGASMADAVPGTGVEEDSQSSAETAQSTTAAANATAGTSTSAAESAAGSQSTSKAGSNPSDGGATASDAAANPGVEGAIASDAGPIASDDGAKQTDAGTMPSDDGAKPSDAGVKPSDDSAKPSDDGVWVVCIDPGHQLKGSSGTEPVAPGSDVRKAKVSSGTSGTTTGIPEYKLTLALGLMLRERLESAGVTVVMTRTVDEVDISNIERAEVANEAGADLFVRIHADGSTDAAVAGISMLVPGDEYLSDADMLAQSASAGRVVLESTTAATGAKNRGVVERDDMSGFNWSKVPAILIEVGFMTNPDEDGKLATDDYRSLIADGMCEGILAWLKSR